MYNRFYSLISVKVGDTKMPSVKQQLSICKHNFQTNTIFRIVNLRPNQINKIVKLF